MLKVAESMLEVVKSSLGMLNVQGVVVSAEGKT